jgi:CDP-glucose 4,6-dehydratase
VGERSRSVEGLVSVTGPDRAFWAGRRVLVTGHTGFKGGWLCAWLQAMGAETHGFALEPPTQPNLFTVAAIERGMASHTLGDVRDVETVARIVERIRPEVLFHLAAQPLVRRSYQQPLETYAVNVMGTAHVLDAVRRTGGVRAVVNVTTDKCYENRESHIAFTEDEPLGGFDPYSNSKACSELVTAAYRRSFLTAAGVAVATARAGNVIGGGDWAEDRLVPDILRAFDAGAQLTIRAPRAVRPWQHVLEPITGYLMLAARLYTHGAEAAEAWNFGPASADARPVEAVVEHIASRYPALSWRRDPLPQPHESGYLMLDSDKAQRRLDWRPRWTLAAALDKTIAWHRAWRQGAEMRGMTLGQIAEYVESAPEAGHAAV